MNVVSNTRHNLFIDIREHLWLNVPHALLMGAFLAIVRTSRVSIFIYWWHRTAQDQDLFCCVSLRVHTGKCYKWNW